MDRRIACIYIENFCFKSETIRQSFVDDDVVLIYATGQSKRYVVDVSKGVSPRMIGASLDFALEHYPDATLCEADFSYYHQEFYKILARIHSKTDQFQQAGLGIVYIDLLAMFMFVIVSCIICCVPLVCLSVYMYCLSLCCFRTL